MRLVARILMQKTKILKYLGKIKWIKWNLWKDEALTESIESIDWGILDQGQSKTLEAYLENIGYPAAFSMHPTNWNPQNAGDYIAITWDAEGKTLSSGETFKTILTISVSNQITNISEFSVDVTITGTA